jgi:hypothetical protein
MDVATFQHLLQPLTDAVAGRALDAELQRDLEARFPAEGDWFGEVEKACHAAIEAGWMCSQGGDGRRFGRVIEAADATGNLSVDVVDLIDIVGPHHRHPNGEVCMVMPQDEGATFDHGGAGWQVNEPNSAHRPTVRDGRALVLYLLPGGEIEFTGQ